MHFLDLPNKTTGAEKLALLISTVAELAREGFDDEEIAARLDDPNGVLQDVLEKADLREDVARRYLGITTGDGEQGEGNGEEGDRGDS